jgi:hypothetical protein
MVKQFEGNEDWIKRGEGRIPTKGAMAAERASAGLGTSDDDSTLTGQPSPQLTVWAKPAPRSERPGKQ